LIMDKKKINRTLFKYRECNDYSFKIFDERELWFSKPESLNDPFDCQLDFEASLRHALSKVSMSKLDKVDDIIKEASDYVKSIGILSLSRTKRNILMWSHYAEEHKGFCIGFKESNLLSSIETIEQHDVTYQSDLPFDELLWALDAYDDAESRIENQITSESVREAFLKALVATKFSNWKYEYETRMVSRNSGVYKFSSDCISQVIFGFKMSEEHKDRLFTTLSHSEWSHVKVYQASKSKDKYGIELNEI
ncbi:TPA: DUF2971 domain-containing protein, partial [Vibrio parahaemolyticus]